MLREFNHKLALIVKKRMTAKVILLALLSLQTISIMADPPKAVWYRYYDSKGIANVSSSVTPNHIRYGYEALDSNMQVIQRARPYNAEKDAPQREDDDRVLAAFPFTPSTRLVSIF